ncbi:MAG: chitobiase/beta-hexosaminidase C-terminal domain-containing protein [Oscillospiraceae bacterium]|nr:chitobiase/beta-hexosaminidase C-terminal domain-containing protein [Oscillospiraceae bacterium]
MKKILTSLFAVAFSFTILTVSAFAEEHYTISHKSGTYTTAQFVRITPDDNAQVYYTTDGSMPDRNSAKAAATIIVKDNTMLRTAAYINGKLVETSMTNYTIRTVSPKASVKSGEFSAPFHVKLSCSDKNATIYYTTDGTTPTKKSNPYTEPILISETTSLKFAAFSDDHARSLICSRKYTISKDEYSDPDRQRLFDLINKTRAYYGIAPVEELPQLSEIAQQRAKECASYFSHWRANGTKWDSLLANAGLKRNARGENIAYYYTTADGALNCWMSDPYHKANVLAADARYVGIGCYNNGYCTCWTHLYIGEN